ncbi:MAG: anhydro-N-acetylmuramic acid kinase [Rhodothermales bacterium]|nr:anhydro-N-acetylmuramic acid kinase [Rhodothermales bacterium]
MSGTSLDGIDVAVMRLEGHGRELRWELLQTASHAFEPALRDELLAAAEDAQYPVDSFCRLGPRLARAYAEALADTEAELIGCHGQTLRHQPDPAQFAGAQVSATLQVVDGAALSVHAGVPVVTGFREGDVALGGQGAPLVPYVDWILFGHDTEQRVALNLGGIANVTWLPAGGAATDILAFDTGPANMLIDAVAQEALGVPFDDAGAAASRGRVLPEALERALGHPFFARRPPKSAGRQSGDAGFGRGFADRFVQACGDATPEDMLATAVEVTVVSLSRAMRSFLPSEPHRIIASGGGTRNAFLMARLADRLPGVTTSHEFGVDAHFKEAMAFAILAHEAVGGVATGLPSVTGASRAAVLGSISWP